ncbi:MAG TPA: cupin domain-containing protein [Pseudonocardiaceae bacterium]|nr:cupin domain-containing protein [Pseudonocardiaceae bacterium]
MTMAAAVRSYRMGDQGEGEILAEAGDGMPVAIWRIRVLPGGGPAPHIHHDWAEAFYVLTGRFRFRLGETDRDVDPGDFVLAPKGQVHGFTNIASQPSRLLCVAPPTALAEVEALADLVNASAGQPHPAAIAELFERHHSAIVAPGGR